MNLPEAGNEWLLEILDLQNMGQGVYTGAPAPDGRQRTRMYGGQLIAQALAAGSFTTPRELQCQSLHAYFVRPGQASRPTEFEVANVRDGRSSALRKVMAVQRDELICELTASFSSLPAEAQIHDFQVAMPDVPTAEHLYREAQAKLEEDRALDPLHRRLIHYGPLQLMPAHASLGGTRLMTWIRVKDTLVTDPHLHACALAYVSDLGAVHASMYAIGAQVNDPQWQVASLDHAVWFHRPFRADEWLLFAFDCTTVAAERGLNHGRVFSQRGELVASITQEALLRLRDPAQA